MPVDVSPEAELDLEQIADYIAQDNPNRALSFIAELRGACRRIGDAPLATQSRTDLAPGMRVRSFGNYMIFLTINNDRVVITRILHGARLLPAEFGNADEDSLE